MLLDAVQMSILLTIRGEMPCSGINWRKSLSVTLLVDKGIATRPRNLDGNSALNWALIENHSDIFKVILNALPADSTSLSRESSLTEPGMRVGTGRRCEMPA